MSYAGTYQGPPPAMGPPQYAAAPQYAPAPPPKKERGFLEGWYVNS